MAKRKKKLSVLKAALKYELYGIIILILSVIALSQEGRVARALTYLFRFLIGTSDWVIPIIFIYIGLFVMMKRAWPNTWSPWKTGVLLGLLGWMLFNHMSMFRLLDPHSDLINPTYIISDTWTSMANGLHPTGNEPDILKREVGGGMIGALLYGSLYFLFGNVGSTIIMVAMFMISFILITGISFVDIGMKMRGQSSELQQGLKERLIQFFSRSHLAKGKNSTRTKRPKHPSFFNFCNLLLKMLRANH
jgi:S-DNA-T family DNA segregation ATPase FtsK/SpoIIIE